MNFSTKLLLSLFVPLIISQLNSNIAAATDNGEKQILLSIKSDLIDPLSALSSWKNDSLDFCKWRGISCTTNDNVTRVTAINLNSSGLNGTLSPLISNLTFLQRINLHNNSIHGIIPEFLNPMKSLKYLDFSSNKFDGLIPPSIYNISSLTFFNVYNNNLSGTLAPNVGHVLQSLQTLNLGFNNFHGDLPSSLGLLKSLRDLNIGGNHFVSNDFRLLITSLTNCSALVNLNLMYNNFLGSLPNTVGNFSTKLEMLLMGFNQIYGIIPREIGNLMSLTELHMDVNNLTGILPSTIGNLYNLERLLLSYNKLSGPIPSSIGNLTKLLNVSMHTNELNGTIPASLGNCKNLEQLKICQNKFEGVIPKEIFSLSSLTIELDLGENLLLGPIPSEIGKLVNLQNLSLWGNRLTGEIPKALGQCQALMKLLFRGNSLQGIIPNELENLRGLAYIDLSQNNLSGEIPKFFNSFHGLEFFDLAFNDLEGQVPDGGVFSNTSIVFLQGNKGLCVTSGSKLNLPHCTSHSSKPGLKSSKFALIVTVIVLAVIASSCLLICILSRFKNTKKENKLSTCQYLDEKYKKVSYSDLAKATDGFSPSNFVGSGSFGSVYKGTLYIDHENLVAVKVFNLEQHGALKSFTSECESLRNIRHKNLVSIVTSCSTLDSIGNEFKALVFKYVPHGNLEEWIHSKSQGKKLSLDDIINIALDVASALSYLHHGCETPLVHCDLKPSNILIDTDMAALVGDFGLARFLPPSNSTNAGASTGLIGLKGSVGYIAPEYALGGAISPKGDVYSYGIVLLEMFTGKRPTDAMFKDGFNVRNYVSNAFQEEKLRSILDSRMMEELECSNDNDEKHNDMIMKNCIKPLLELGLGCSVDASKDRMNMEDVVVAISKIKAAFSKSKEMNN